MKGKLWRMSQTIEQSNEHEVVVNAVKIMEKNAETRSCGACEKKTFFTRKKFNKHKVL